MNHLRIGEYDCYSFCDAIFRLDGGGMFGIVPKNIWNRFYDCDEQNRITMAASVLLVRGRGISLMIPHPNLNNNKPDRGWAMILKMISTWSYSRLLLTRNISIQLVAPATKPKAASHFMWRPSGRSLPWRSCR